MPTRPNDLFTSNHFYLEIPGLVSPQFHTVEGIGVESGEVTLVDGYTNIQHKFSSQLKKAKDVTLTRSKDGSVDDLALKALTKKCLDEGFRFDCHLVKRHNGNEVFRILLLGCRIKTVDYPTHQTDAEERYDMKYMLSVTEVVEL